MKYPPRYFSDGLPDWKRKKDPILSRLFYRPISFLVSAFFCEIGWSANSVTIFSMLVALATFLLFAFNMPLAGAVLLNVWLVLDCTDGNMARCVRREPYGDFLDGISGYICSCLVFVGVGYSAYMSGGLLFEAQNPLIFLLGALAGACEALSRLVYQRFLNTIYEQGVEAKKNYDPAKTTGINRMRLTIDQNVAIGGLMPALVLVCTLLHSLDLIALGYGIYFSLMFLGATAYFVRKTITANTAIPNSNGEDGGNRI